jgi:dUTP pyrophosphatase
VSSNELYEEVSEICSFQSRMTSPKKVKMSDEVEVMQVAKLTDKAIIPTKGSKLAAGYDLYSAYDYVVPAGGKIMAKTDIQVKVPHGTYGRVAPRCSDVQPRLGGF